MFGGPTFPLFRAFGFPVGAHWSLPLALILAGVRHGGVGGVFLSVLLFASVLAHELGHAVVARRLGVAIDGIDLNLLGGVAKMRTPPSSPNDELKIAIAGPVVSLALAALFLPLALIPGLPQSVATVVLWLGGANLMLGVFNLLPALPMDGGRVLRALLAKRKGYVAGTLAAVSVSRVLAVALGAFGLWANPWLILLAVFVWLLGTAEKRAALAHAQMRHMGFWHPAHVPWGAYDDAARPAR